ncbi:MAG TPA: histidine kinase dimerization/phosphoacceptor domain -containing protein [Leptospiraceae bacterium]|nr:histidine kinase dimerization/phosphoacceptor domain -containing protein [Leptospiraceae bacterium]HRG74224.1 histidine kinase dimerization/phosphoacceptor domain -containing protein [Leptospiraceae bacterium]
MILDSPDKKTLLGLLRLEMKINILIVDDNEDNLLVMTHILKDPEYNLVMARSGKEALRLVLNANDFALIFMDVHMPGMDGLETASLIRQREKTSNIPIIFLTAYDQNEAQVFKGYSLGAVDFLTKPIAIEILNSKVSVFVDLYRKNKILKVQEEMLTKSNERLEVRVDERTIELNQVNIELRKEIGDREALEVKMKESIKEKEFLLREIHHRVKNNLQIISSILHLQSSSVHNEKANAIFDDSQSRIKSMALVHETLYQSGNLARINFHEYLQNLIINLFRCYGAKNIKYEIHLDEIQLNLDSAIPCGLIINELITNSIKYAFPDREGMIIIRLTKNEKGLDELSVEDNGIGLPINFDYQNTKSLGFQIVVTLAKQINAILKVDRTNGTCFKIQLPVGTILSEDNA